MLKKKLKIRNKKNKLKKNSFKIKYIEKILNMKNLIKKKIELKTIKLKFKF